MSWEVIKLAGVCTLARSFQLDRFDECVVDSYGIVRPSLVFRSLTEDSPTAVTSLAGADIGAGAL